MLEFYIFSLPLLLKDKTALGFHIHIRNIRINIKQSTKLTSTKLSSNSESKRMMPTPRML